MKFKIPPAPVKAPIHTVQEALDALKTNGLYLADLNYQGAYFPKHLPRIEVRLCLEMGPGVDVADTMKQLHEYAAPKASKMKQW